MQTDLNGLETRLFGSEETMSRPPFCVLECTDVDLFVGHKPLLKHVSFKLFAGRSLALVGANGLGKTTLLRVCAGIAEAQGGQIEVMGEQIWPKREISNEHGCCFLASNPALLSDHSVYGNLEFMMNCFGLRPTWPDLENALCLVGLSGRGKQQARTLSTGQKRRLSLAFLLLLKPKIILADEPTNGLDTNGIELCLKVFDELKQQGSAICTATHDVRLIDFCDEKMELEGFLPSRQAISRNKPITINGGGVFS